MGDAADMFIDGTLDSETGELIDGSSPGHPRRRKERDYPPRRYVCPICKRRFGTMEGREAHRKAKHPPRLP